jgi:hypothetical protein
VAVPRETVDYMKACQASGETAQEQQLFDLAQQALLSQSFFTLAHVTEAMNLLRETTFTLDSRRKLVGICKSKMRPSSGTSTGRGPRSAAATCPRANVVTAPLYFLKEDWDELCSPHAEWQDQLDVVTRRAKQLGLVNCSEDTAMRLYACTLLASTPEGRSVWSD